jgi:hypothetical protein
MRRNVLRNPAALLLTLCLVLGGVANAGNRVDPSRRHETQKGADHSAIRTPARHTPARANDSQRTVAAVVTPPPVLPQLVPFGLVDSVDQYQPRSVAASPSSGRSPPLFL